MKHGVLAVFLAFLVTVLVPTVPVMSTELKVTKRDCDKIVRYTPSADIAYKPGVDVYGNKVVGADVSGSSAIKIPDEISFDYGIDLEKKYGLGRSGAATGNPTIGKVTIKGGRAYWNGTLLDDSDQVALAAECRRIYGE